MKKQDAKHKVPPKDRSEFNHIRQLVMDAQPLTDKDVRKVLDHYFNTVQWSIIKDEWSNHMTEEQRTALCATLLSETSR